MERPLQLTTEPSSLVLMIASYDDSTIIASRLFNASLSTRAVTSVNEVTTPTGWSPPSAMGRVLTESQRRPIGDLPIRSPGPPASRQPQTGN